MASIGTSGGLENEPASNLRQRLLPSDIIRAQTIQAREGYRADARPDLPRGETSAAGSSTASAPREKTIPASPAVDLASAERIHLRVRGSPELSGEYRVNPDLTISVNGIGRISVGSTVGSDFETQLADRFSTDLRRDVSVAVEIARFRPFFVTGQVAQPGAIEWRPELTLIQAISLSGGIVRGSSSTVMDTPERSLLQQQARAQLRFALAQLSRLRAERDGNEGVESTRTLDSVFEGVSPDSRQAVEQFMGRQNGLLSEQRALLQARISRLEKERESAKNELEAATLQANEIKTQLDLTKEMMNGLEQLKAQKLLPNQKYIAQRRDMADIRVRYSEARVAVERARGRVGSLTRDIEAVQMERRALLNERIETLEREVVQLELTLGDTSRDQRASQETTHSVNYHIARKSPNGVQTIPANLFTEVFPGDVVIVSSQQRQRSSATARGTPAVTTASASGTSSSLERTQQIMESSAGMMPSFGRLISTRIGGSASN